MLEPEHDSSLDHSKAQAQSEWKAHTSGVQPAFSWAVTGIAGVLAISIFPVTNILRLLTPVLCLVAYSWVTYPRTLPPAFRAARVAQLADSAYFLGFLWTLWALIDSFVLKHTDPNDAAFRAFGYALFTTFAGMAIRLYLLNFKYGAEEQAGEAELLIEHRLQALGDAMQAAHTTVQDFARNTGALNKQMSSLSEALIKLDTEFAGTHKETTEAIKKNIDNTVQEIRTSLKSPLQEYGRAIRAFTSGVDHGSQLFTEITDKSCRTIGDSVQAAADRVQAQIKSGGERVASDYAAMMQEVSNKIADFLAAATRLAAELAKIDFRTEPLSQVTECLVALNTSILAIGDAIGPEGALRVNIGHAAEEIKLQSVAVGSALSDIAQRIGHVEIPASLTLDFSKLNEALKGLEGTVVSLAEKASDPRLEKAPQTASDAIFKLTTSVHNFRQSIEKADAAIAGIGERDSDAKPARGKGFLSRFFRF